MDNFWVSHWDHHTEANLVLMNNNDWFYQVAPLRLLGAVP